MSTKIPDRLLAAFAEAVAVALREMAMAESAPHGAGGEPDVSLSAVLPVATAAGAGYLALSLPERTASALARRVLAPVAAVTEPDPEVVRDCAAEIVNVVAGQAKTLLRGTPYHFNLATPRVEPGATADATAYVIGFVSEVGSFALQVRLPV